MKSTNLLKLTLTAALLVHATNPPTATASGKALRAPTLPTPTHSAGVAAHAEPSTKTELPPLPEGVTDLQFKDIYKRPVGPRGLEFTDKAQALHGRRVRMLGYMVKQSRPMPWTLLLSPVPMALHEKEYGLAEDLPPQVVHAFTEKSATPILPYTPGLLLLTGRLELGAREEPDERVSYIRLHLDPPTPEQRKALGALASQTGKSSNTNLTEKAVSLPRP